MMSPARRLSDRHPFEIYVLVWALVSSLPSAVGLAEVPSSISRQLPGWPSRVWAIGLCVGCIVALIGLAWHRPPFPHMSVTGLSFEQVGLTIVGCSTILYAAAALLTVGDIAFVPAGIVLAFGLACFAQALKIRRVLAMSRPL